MVTNEGLCIESNNKKNTLRFNGKRCVEVFEGKDRYGVCVSGDTLSLCGTSLALASDKSAVERLDDDLFFGDVKLNTDGEVINLTAEDYGKLLSGSLVAGHKRYDRASVYNIVQDVGAADVITYTKDKSQISFDTGYTAEASNDMMYANAAGTLSENSEDLTETVLNTACPNLTIRRFESVVPVGGKIAVRYFVDTRDMASWNHNTVSDTFTVIIKTASGSVSKRTTYAGEFTLETPAFANAGESWFSIRCIDSNGVGSVTQYFNVLVRDAVSDAPFYMEDYLDGETVTFTYNDSDYTIYINDNTVAHAISNKAALSAFFAFAKSEGANRVVFHNNGNTVYWIDYHQSNGLPAINNDGKPCGGDNIVFPNSITIDLNGSTIAATQFNDLIIGQLVYPYRNFDVHIINGSVKGCYDGFDFATTLENTGNTGEHISVCAMEASRFCSFENLDISGALGYDGLMSSENLIIGTDLSFTDGKRVNLSNGNLIDAENMVVTQKINVNPSWSEGVITFGRGGYCGYLNTGTQREIFASFYGSNDTYITSVKSKLYEPIIVPEGAASVIMTGYGVTLADGDENDRDWAWETDRGRLKMFNPRFSHNIIYRNCHWHDTRTTAITNAQSRQCMLDGCTFTNIAKEPAKKDGGWGAITPLLGDLEDSWNWCNGWCIRNCSCVKGSGDNSIKIFYVRNVDIEGCEGIKINDTGGVESGFIENNNFPFLHMYRNRSCYHPCVVYKNNTYGSVLIEYGRFGDNPVVFNNGVAERVVTMVGCVFEKKCGYHYLNLRNSINGDDYVD